MEDLSAWDQRNETYNGADSCRGGRGEVTLPNMQHQEQLDPCGVHYYALEKEVACTGMSANLVVSRVMVMDALSDLVPR